MHILITGNPVDGFIYTGPFDTSDAAIQAADDSGSDWWIAELATPEPDPRYDVDGLKALAYGDVDTGRQPLDLDDLVHDAASAQGSEVNNAGIDSQVDYLVEHLGYFQAQTFINDAHREQR